MHEILRIYQLFDRILYSGMNSETILECSKSREPNSALFFAAIWKQLESYNPPCFQSIPWRIPGAQVKETTRKKA